METETGKLIAYDQDETWPKVSTRVMSWHHESRDLEWTPPALTCHFHGFRGGSYSMMFLNDSWFVR